MNAQPICAVIVTYNPARSLVENAAAISAQVSHVVVVDNGSSGETDIYLDELETRLRSKVIRNHQNLGIAAALNLGVEYAIDVGCDWICTLDQDSCVSSDFISTMLYTYRQARQPGRVAVISPTYVDSQSGVTARLRTTPAGEILTTMTSGSMVPSSTFRTLGYFDSDLFIDGVDTEFCLRARREGMLIIQSPAVLFHSLGRPTYHRLLGLCFETTNHSAGRHYYISRNRLKLLARYAADWPWIWREIRQIIFDIAKIALVEERKWEKFRAMAAGAADALRGKVGKQVEL